MALRFRGGTQVNGEDADAAIVNLRSDYERRLGQSPYDPEEISYEDKATLLKRIYNGDKEAQMTRECFKSLLNNTSVFEIPLNPPY
jgi:hypothetical protein